MPIHYSNQIKYLEKLRNEKDSFILELENFAKENKVPILNWNSAEFLEQLIIITKPKRVLEIGTAIGYSTIRIARNLNSGATVDTIELSKNNIPIAINNFIKSGLTEKIKLLEGNAKNIMPHLKDKYNFIFLDVDKEDYEELFYLSLNLLKKGGIFFVDNLLWQGFAASDNMEVPNKYKRSTNQIRKFNKLFLNEPVINSIILPIGDGIGVGIKIKN